MLLAIGARVSKEAVVGVALVSAAAALLIGIGAAAAEDGAPCSFNNASYPDGSNIHFNGGVFDCIDGQWVQAPPWNPKDHNAGPNESRRQGKAHPSVLSGNVGQNSYEELGTPDPATTEPNLIVEPANLPSQSNSIGKNAYRQSVSGFH